MAEFKAYIDEAGFRALTDGILETLGELVGSSLCFVGDGFDPSSAHSADDEEAIERSEAWAAVFFVPPGTLPALREAVAGQLIEHRLPTAWVIPSDNDADIVIRARNHRRPHDD